MKICSGSSDCMLMPPRKCSSQTSMSTAVVRNSTCATMATREATMEWWWLPMIPCAMAITCRLPASTHQQALSPRARRQRRRRDGVAAGQFYRERQCDDEAAGAGEREAVGLGTLAWPAVAAFLHGSAGVLTIPAARGRLAWPRESEVTLGRWSWVWYITEQDV